ncbi:MAG: FAD-binding oxidoreductase [Bacteroidota bacterium]
MQSKTLEHDLRPLTAGGCFFDQQTLQQYSSDRCWYKVTPLCVIQPTTADEVSAIAAYCNERGIPLIARGAATGLAGQAIGMGVILDFTKSMNSILFQTNESVSVQPGLVLGALNAELAKSGRFFPVDPASAAECTLGGMIGTNAAGAHGVRYGATKDHVHSLTLVLSNGEKVVLRHPPAVDSNVSPFFSHIAGTLTPLLLANISRINSRFPDVRKNSSGYNLKDAVAGKDVDFRKLIVGSEGTLAIVVEATLGTTGRPLHRLGALIYFSSYEQATDATLVALELGPSAIEILDHTYVSLVKGFKPSTDRLILDEAKALLYVEFEGNNTQDVQQSVEKLIRDVSLSHPLKIMPLATENELRSLWELREEASRVINSGTSTNKASFIEDVAVPVKHLPHYITGLGRILKGHGIEFSLYGHAGTGNIHCAAFVDLTDLRHFRLIDTVALEVYDLAISLGGTLSGEHGDGFVRTPFLQRLYGPEVFELFRTVKRTFDPNTILNPGKITGDQHATILHDLNLP